MLIQYGRFDDCLDALRSHNILNFYLMHHGE